MRGLRREGLGGDGLADRAEVLPLRRDGRRAVTSLYDCRGCGVPLAEGEEGNVWVQTPIGMTCLKVCRTQECGRAAIQASGGRMLPGNHPPIGDKERDRLERERRAREDAERRAGRSRETR